jgi:hypothetical protein
MQCHQAGHVLSELVYQNPATLLLSRLEPLALTAIKIAVFLSFCCAGTIDRIRDLHRRYQFAASRLSEARLNRHIARGGAKWPRIGPVPYTFR